MKKRELKQLAVKIAEAEKIIKSSEDGKEKRIAMKEVDKLCEKVSSLEDLETLDEMIQELLTNK